MEKLDHKAIRVDVEVTTERNPRQAGRKERVELTITTRGPAIRAEAAAEDRFAALDLALAKLESRLRRACDRRKGHYAAAGRSEVGGEPVLTGRPTAEPGCPGAARPPDAGRGPRDKKLAPATAAPAQPASRLAPGGDGCARHRGGDHHPHRDGGRGPLVVREKLHVACPMTVDQALFEMELVGHDFFLFTDTGAGLPSVVYRRRGYEYGVIRLVADAAAAVRRAGERALRQAANLATG